MGSFNASVVLKNLAHPERQRTVSLLVDTGSLFTWVSTPALEEIGVEPVETRKFKTITGALVERKLGYVIVAHDGRSGATNVVFAEPGDMEVLGVTALETLTVAPDPVKQVLIPIVALAVQSR
jgi:predicted aspartyl protease